MLRTRLCDILGIAVPFILTPMGGSATSSEVAAAVANLGGLGVAERLRYPPETALTLGRFVAGSSARARGKARRLGISDEKQDAEERHARAAELKPRRQPGRLVQSRVVWDLCCNHRPSDHKRLLKLKVAVRLCQIELGEIAGWPAWNCRCDRRQIGAGRSAVWCTSRVRQCMVQVFLVLGIELRDVVGGLLHEHIGHDAVSLNGATRRCVMPGDRQQHGGAFGQRDRRLHRAFAETPSPNQYHTMVILQCSCDDIAGGGGTAVDQHHHWCAGEDVLAPGAQPFAVVAIAGACGYN
jgi:hypothetical protein